MTTFKVGDLVTTTYTNITNKTGVISAIYLTAATIETKTGQSHHKLSRLVYAKEENKS